MIRLRDTLSRSNMAMSSYDPDMVCVHCDPDLGDMILGQGHYTPLGHGQ